MSFPKSRYKPGWVAAREEGFWWIGAPTNLTASSRPAAACAVQENIAHGRPVKCLFKGRVECSRVRRRASSLALRSLPCLLPLTAPWGVGQPYPGEGPHGGKFRIGTYIRQAGSHNQTIRGRTLDILGWGMSPPWGPWVWTTMIWETAVGNFKGKRIIFQILRYVDKKT